MMILKPVDNPLRYEFNNIIVEFINVHELSQGGPETGNLIINGFGFDKKLRFGTTILFYKQFLILPRYKWSWELFKNGNFKLCMIEINSKSILEFGKVEILLMPKEVKEENVLYYTDLNNTNLLATRLPKIS